MKKLFFAFIAGACLATAACAPVIVGNAPLPIAQASTLDEKALIAAETAFNVPAYAYVELDAKGLLSDSLKADLKPLLLGGYEALKAARLAYEAGDAETFNAQVEAALKFAETANGFLPKGN